jgi:hypothetical protein
MAEKEKINEDKLNECIEFIEYLIENKILVYDDEKENFFIGWNHRLINDDNSRAYPISYEESIELHYSSNSSFITGGRCLLHKDNPFENLFKFFNIEEKYKVWQRKKKLKKITI